MNADGDDTLREVLVAYGLEIQTAARASSGLINQTWIVQTAAGERYVAQRLHPIFPPAVNDTIQFATRCLDERNVRTPHLAMTLEGGHHVSLDGAVWRVLTFVSGASYDVVPDVHHAFEAGSMLARFHGAFVGRKDTGSLPQSRTHDLSRHLDSLRDALDDCSAHDDFASAAALAHEIFAFAETLPHATETPARVVHGDPKISNVLFDPEGRAMCLVDLDTIGRMALPWELGDAFRSWCNPRGENTKDTVFSLELFGAALAGYAEIARDFITSREIDVIVPAIETIYTELAARFCADALKEAYFAWDSARFPSRTAHNLVRARGQLNAARDFAMKQQRATDLVRRVFAAGA